MTTPNDNLDFEQEGTGTPGLSGALLDDAAPAKAVANASAAIVDAVDFDDEEIYRRPGELAVCKEESDTIKHRFSVLPDPSAGADKPAAFLRRAYVHPVTGKGYARCFSKRNKKGEYTEQAFCCKQCLPDNVAQQRLGALVVEYTCIDPATGAFKKGLGTPEVPFTFEIKALMLSGYASKTLKEKAGLEESADSSEIGGEHVLKVQDVDYYYMGRGSKKKGHDYERISPKATYLRNPKITAQIMEAVKPYADGVALANRICQVLTVAKMKEFLGIGGGGTPAGDDAAFQDL